MNPPAPLRVALYARVSTKNQDPLNQVPVLERYAQERGYAVYQLYVDTASGCNPNRPAWRKLAEDAHRHKFDLVVAVRLDRLMRSLSHLLTVIDAFKREKVGIELLDLGRLDTETPAGQLAIQILGAVAQWERSIIADRTRAVLEEKRKQGIVGGRPAKKIDIDTAARLRLAGYSVKKAAEKMHCTYADLNNRRHAIKARMAEIRAERGEENDQL